MKRLLSLLGGVLIGAIAALLLAPQSGSETREQIKKLVQEKMPNLRGEELEKFVDQLIAKVKGLTVCACETEEEQVDAE